MTLEEDQRHEPNRSPRVAIIAYTEYPWDPRVRREAETLLDEGFSIDVIALRPKSGPSPPALGGINLHEVPLSIRRGGRLQYVYQYAVFFALSTVFLLLLMHRRGVDLVHVHSLPDFQVFCAFPAKLRRIPVLLDLHEGMPEIVAARFHVSMRSPIARAAAIFEGVSARFANHVISANDAVRDAVISRGVDRSHITAVYNAVPGIARRPSTAEVRRKLNLSSDRFLVFAGGINPERDLETFFRAVARLPPDTRASLVIAGDGEDSYLNALWKLAGRLGIADRVRFVGKLTIEDARALLTLSELGVVTLQANPLTEIAWPTRVLEYVALNKPLIVPSLGFMRSILEDGAYYYAPGDAADLARTIDTLLRDPQRADRAIAKARQICERFEWSKTRDVFLRVFRVLEASNDA